MTEDKQKAIEEATKALVSQIVGGLISLQNPNCNCGAVRIVKKLAMKYPVIFVDVTNTLDSPAADYSDTVNWVACQQIDDFIDVGNKGQAALVLRQNTSWGMKECKLKIEKRIAELNGEQNSKKPKSRKLELDG